MAPATDARLPTFLVIGAAKAGTTSLFHYLSAHPQVFMPSVKEVDFFVEELNWPKGMAWYENHFKRAADAIAVGEASTNYARYPRHKGVPGRIAASLPSARLIYCVRDPIERIRSEYEHRRKKGQEREELLDAAIRKRPKYVDTSRYAMQLEQYLEHFRREQILVMTAERLRHDRLAAVRQVYDFVGVDSTIVPDVIEQEFYRSDDRRTHSRAGFWARKTLKRYVPASTRAKELFDRRPGLLGRGTSSNAPSTLRERKVEVPAPVRDRLVEELRDDVRRLRSYLPGDFDGWGIA